MKIYFFISLRKRIYCKNKYNFLKIEFNNWNEIYYFDNFKFWVFVFMNFWKIIEKIILFKKYFKEIFMNYIFIYEKDCLYIFFCF